LRGGLALGELAAAQLPDESLDLRRAWRVGPREWSDQRHANRDRREQPAELWTTSGRGQSVPDAPPREGRELVLIVPRSWGKASARWLGIQGLSQPGPFPSGCGGQRRGWGERYAQQFAQQPPPEPVELSSPRPMLGESPRHSGGHPRLRRLWTVVQ